MVVDERSEGLAQALLALAQLVGKPRPLPALLATAARVIGETLGYRTVCANLMQEPSGRLRAVAVHGTPAARAALEGVESEWEDWSPFLAARYERGGVYLVPAGDHDWSETNLRTFTPALESSGDPDRWDPEDALFVPLRQHDGELMGMLSVDEPLDGRRPDPARLAELAAMSAHVGHAIASARATAADAARARALEALLGIAATNERHGAQVAVSALLAETRRALGYGRVEMLDAPPSDGAAVVAVTDPAGTVTGWIVASDPSDGPLPMAERVRLLRTVGSQVQSLLHSAAHRALERSEARKDAVVRASIDAIITLDADGRIIDFNPAAERMFGAPRADVLGEDLVSLAMPADTGPELRAAFAEDLAAQAAGAVSRRLEATAQRADGTPFPCEVVVAATEDHQGHPLFTVYVRDISLERRARETLRAERDRARHAALHDALTGTLSRRGFEEGLAALLGDPGPAAVVGCVDIDDFGAINEAFGTEVGDRVLVEVAEVLRRLAGPETLVARTGSDEFTLAARPDERTRALHAIRDGLATPLRLGGGVELQLGFSWGLVLAEEGASAELAVHQAKSALRRARSLGSGAAWFTPGRDRPGEDVALVAELRAALARDELELHYQPMCRVGDGEAVGYEALLRWRRADGTLVPPAAFIPLAESSGQIEPIGAWVIEEACRRVAAWDAAGAPPRFVSVNVSPRQLRRPGLVETITRALDANGLRPDRLMVEVTESTMMNVTAAERVLGQLQDLGVRCAIDDFGADYSSLARLASLPVSVIKLDRSFLAGVPAHPRATRVAAAILELCASLELETVAEGVETAEQLAFVSGRATIAQGFLLGRPRPAREL